MTGSRWLAAAGVVLAVTGCESDEPDVTAGTDPGTTAPAEVATTPGGTPTNGPTAMTPPDPTSPGLTPTAPAATSTPLADPVFEEFALPPGTRPHDVAPAADGTVWFTAQRGGALGRLDPATGDVQQVPLGSGSAPHGVIVGPDGHAWVTDSGRNAIQRVDATDLTVEEFALPGGNANLNTATFDGDGQLWFTGQAGVYGTIEPSGAVTVHEAPRGTGPYGIATTPDGTVWYASLAGSYIARIDDAGGALTTYDVPTAGAGARRIWSDSSGDLWVTEWLAGRLARFSPAAESWSEWDLPGDAQPYAVYVDDRDHVWVTDFGADALVRFDPVTEEFRSFPFPTTGAEVRQLLGRHGEVWGVGSAINTAIVLRTAG